MNKNQTVLWQDITPEKLEEPVGTSKNGNVDKSAVFYHVTSHSFGDEKIYNYDIARYRQNCLFDLCRKNEIRVIFSVVQPTHSHDVIFCKEFANIEKTFKTLNRLVSHYVRIRNKKYYTLPGLRVFSDRPAYQPVKTYSHLLFLAKYLYDNGQGLRDQGKNPPYCCFDEMERGFFKNFDPQLYISLFNIPVSEIINKCKSLTKNEFMSFCEERFESVDKELERSMFSKVD